MTTRTEPRTAAAHIPPTPPPPAPAAMALTELLAALEGERRTHAAATRAGLTRQETTTMEQPNDRLARFILDEMPQEIGPDEGAVDVAIRLLRPIPGERAVAAEVTAHLTEREREIREREARLHPDAYPYPDDVVMGEMAPGEPFIPPAFAEELAGHLADRADAGVSPLRAGHPEPRFPAITRLAEELAGLAYVSRPRTTDPARVIGAKPAAFAYWMFRLLGARRGDTLDDLYPGSGGIARAWDHYQQDQPA